MPIIAIIETQAVRLAMTVTFLKILDLRSKQTMSEKPTLESTESTDGNPSQMWGGRFTAGPDALMRKINASIGFDKGLYDQDISGSLAHVRMLGASGILSVDEVEAICTGLENVREEIVSGNFDFRADLEDIHMNVEARLVEMIGETAGRLHTARSRNDQVATDFKLWVRDAIDAADDSLRAVQEMLIDQADAHADWVMPGFTHLQAAQPVTVGHHLLAYVEMFGRDRSRFEDARRRLNESPLGAGALAGTSFPIDREATAKTLGFDRPTANSLDTVSDRDFVLEFLAVAAICAGHLSRLGEELVIWSSAQFRFVQLSDSFSTGSSMMPQKRNPDAAELVRGKTGRIMGAFVTLTTVMKGLPLAYSKDMQEDKEPVFDAAETLMLCLAAAAGMMANVTFDRDRLAAAAGDGYTTATDLADWLVREADVPFREAHHIAGQIVALAENRSCGLESLSLEDLTSVDGRITDDIFNVLGVDNSVRSRTSYGGTAPENVRAQIAAARARFL